MLHTHTIHHWSRGADVMSSRRVFVALTAVLVVWSAFTATAAQQAVPLPSTALEGLTPANVQASEFSLVFHSPVDGAHLLPHAPLCVAFEVLRTWVDGANRTLVGSVEASALERLSLLPCFRVEDWQQCSPDPLCAYNTPAGVTMDVQGQVVTTYPGGQFGAPGGPLTRARVVFDAKEHATQCTPRTTPLPKVLTCSYSRACVCSCSRQMACCGRLWCAL